MNREETHAMVDKIFDDLESYAQRNDDVCNLVRLQLRQDHEFNSAEGVIMVTRKRFMPDMPYITWKSDINSGLYAGHYDQSAANADNDYFIRCGRR